MLTREQDGSTVLLEIYKTVFIAKYFPYLIFNTFSMMHVSNPRLSHFYNNRITGSHWQMAKVCCFQIV